MIMNTITGLLICLFLAGSVEQTRAEDSPWCMGSPIYNCYETGFPSCCESNTCSATEQPPCDSPGASFCTWAPNYECYNNGRPSCCDESATCPEQPPECDVAGPPYCSDSPNFDCYSDGFPSCCLTQEDDCPENEPGCDVTGSETTAPGSSPSSSGDSSVLRGPMSLLVLLLSVMFFQL
jgi:hypothetical protein